MATIHLKINGIDGDSEASGFEGQIDCDSWNWGASQAANMHVATGGAAGGSSVGDIHVTKSMDKASPILMLGCCQGRHFDEILMTCTKSSGGTQIAWLEITLKRAIISSINFSGQEGSQGAESMSLNFGEYMMKFYPQAEAGDQGASVDAGYNITLQDEV